MHSGLPSHSNSNHFILNSRTDDKRSILSSACRPLLAYSIMIARATPSIDEVWVTTDSEAYAGIAHLWGAQVVMRPLELSADNTSTLATLQHALTIIQQQSNPIGDSEGAIGYVRTWVPDWVVLLQPNCPLRWGSDVEQLLAKTLIYKDGVLSVQSGPFKIGKVKHSNLHWLPKYSFGIRKQDMAEEYREDGNLYVFKAKNLWDKHRLHGKQMGILKSRPEQSLANIDTQFDFDLTNYLYHQYGYKEMFQELEDQLNG